MKQNQFVYIFLIVAIAVLLFGAVAYFGMGKKSEPIDQQPNASSSPIIEPSTARWRTYRNEQYGFEVKYPTDWYYKEFSPTSTTTNFKTYDTLTKEYKNNSVNELTDYVVAFGASDVLMPTASRGGDGFITIKIFDGTIEDLVNREITRDGALNYLVSVGKATLEDARKNLWGETILVDEREGHKITSRGQIPGAITDYPIEAVRIEKNNKVISITMENIDNDLDINNIYQNILTTFKFIK